MAGTPVENPKASANVKAAADLEADRAVGDDGNYAVAGANMAGITFQKVASGTIAGLGKGRKQFTAGAAIAALAELEVGTSGKLITKASGLRVGVNGNTAATADGDKCVGDF